MKQKRRDLFSETLETGFELSVRNREECLDFLVHLFNQVRPRGLQRTGLAAIRLEQMIGQLREHPLLLRNLRIAVMAQLAHAPIVKTLTDSGMLLSRGFVQEFSSRLSHKFLPALQEEADFLYVINRVFYKKTDYTWVEAISRDSWKTFFEILDFSIDQQDIQLQEQLHQALFLLSYKVANISLEPEVSRYLPEVWKGENIFIQQNQLVNQLRDQQHHEALVTTLEECAVAAAAIREIQSVRGASLSLSYMMLVMHYCLNRMKILVDALDNNRSFNTDRLVDFFRLVVRYENRKNSLRELFSQSFGYVAYQIAEHKGTKGDKYITVTPAQYYRMIWSAMSGGFIVCFMVVIKNLLGKLQLLPLWQGVAYSLNYSIGFIAIEETHSTLATKQPAFTASAVASSLDTRKNEQPNLYNLAITVARVIRSQFASFVGNLLIVFPVSYLFAWLYHRSMGHKLAQGAKAMSLLREQHPWESFSLLYACNTGLFLFISGLLAGFIQNKLQYSRVAERLQMHPVLRQTVPAKRLQRWAHYIENHAGSLVGNIALGFLLGMSGIFVKILGIPFDIRHITISAGNTAIGVYGVGFDQLRPSYLYTVVLGVLGIGFFNFLVSFSLAFIVALKSRGIHLKDYPEFIRILWRYFKKYPLDFIRPRRNSVI